MIAPLLVCGTFGLSHAFRCGEDNKMLATEGMKKYQIEKDCGQPYAKEIIGYDKKFGKYRIIEEWVYIIDDNGRQQMYLIEFDREGYARRIEWLGRQN
jgi:hypothetical protein